MKGMGLHIDSHVQDLHHVYKTRYFHSKSGDVTALSAEKQDWFAWFSKARAYSNVYNCRDYAKVLKLKTGKTVRKASVKVVHKNKVLQHTYKRSTRISVPQVRTLDSNRESHKSYSIPHKEYTPFVIETSNRFAVLNSMDCPLVHTGNMQAIQPLNVKSVCDAKASSKSNSSIKSCTASNKLANSRSAENIVLGDIKKVSDNVEYQGDHSDTVVLDTEPGIPKEVMESKQTCVDYLACMHQNKEGYGFIPVSSLKLYTGDPTYYQNIPDTRTVYQLLDS